MSDFAITCMPMFLLGCEAVRATLGRCKSPTSWCSLEGGGQSWYLYLSKWYGLLRTCVFALSHKCSKHVVGSKKMSAMNNINYFCFQKNMIFNFG